MAGPIVSETHASGDTASLPLFPLHKVLFPGGPLRLRIFEARYVDMIGRCMKQGIPFGVVLIMRGREAGSAVETVDIGTSARIVDFERLDDGLLGIAAQGEQRFRIVTQRREPDGLNVANITWLAHAPAVALPPEYRQLGELLSQALPRVAPLYSNAHIDVDDAGTVAFRLAELLPVPDLDRQAMLEMDDPLERLALLHGLVRVERRDG